MKNSQPVWVEITELKCSEPGNSWKCKGKILTAQLYYKQTETWAQTTQIPDWQFKITYINRRGRSTTEKQAETREKSTHDRNYMKPDMPVWCQSYLNIFPNHAQYTP